MPLGSDYREPRTKGGDLEAMSACWRPWAPEGRPKPYAGTFGRPNAPSPLDLNHSVQIGNILTQCQTSPNLTPPYGSDILRISQFGLGITGWPNEM